MIFEKNPITTTVSIPKSFHLTPFSPTFEIHQPTLTGHIPVYDSRASIRKRERKDKKYSRNEKKVHYVHYTEENTQKEDLEEVVATSEFEKRILEEALAFFSQEDDEEEEAKERHKSADRETDRKKMEKKEALSFAELLLRKEERRDKKETIAEFLTDDEEDEMEETLTEFSIDPKEKPDEQDGIVTTNVRSKTWDKEIVRSFLTGTKQEQIQVLENLRANPEGEELQKFYELLQQCVKKQEEEKQREREEFKKMTKIACDIIRYHILLVMPALQT